ncbi:hypothetical protein [Hymenobacter sp. HDW8]|uniref:hypothetical protein n=1 Tax=Hymenobacter sp. HDW8 TaxID=2714932 RepID=UPI00140C7EE3|nr:hypothetical protein [Hymenobacter sp. HDW8]QIL76705.1 hypothetical protein G7064_13190 [Hymenobacter sp. HDW8]
MKNHFNAQRFGQLFRKHSAEYLNQYLLSTGVLIGVMMLIMGFIAYISGPPLNARMQDIFFMLFLFGAGFIFTSTIFSNLGNKNQAIAALSLPASHFEKYLVGWVYSFIIFLIVFTASFYLVTALVVSLDEWYGQEKEILNVFSPDQQGLKTYIIYAFIHAVAIWGAIFFTKIQFIKTAFLFFLGLGIMAVLNFQILKTLFTQDLKMAMPFADVFLQADKEMYSLELPQQQQQLIILVPIILAFFFWTTAYVRIKEKQI